ncbi:hypothetical protein ABT158_22645 [Nonomuraea sp. NPDC001636]|uniref:hypothetical protein n=1 Tax=Nonomuraea sp. NPDC001636 TaxID=3154391 RepID=UPI00332EAB96
MLIRALVGIAAEHPGRTGASPHRRQQEPHACIAVALLQTRGLTVEDLPSGCDIQNAPNRVRHMFTPGARWLLKRLHQANHRGTPWGDLPDFAERLFAAQERP